MPRSIRIPRGAFAGFGVGLLLASSVGCTTTAPDPDAGGSPCASRDECAPGQTCFKTACDGPGSCQEEQACGEIYAPVCGCDNVTYENACLASNFGAGIAASGECVPDAGVSATCPEQPPTAGGDCVEPWSSDEPNIAFPVAHCTWGDDPRPQCRTRALCSEGQWLLTEPDETLCEDAPLPSECSPTPRVASSECADVTLACWYEDGTRCWCSSCRDGLLYPICQEIAPPAWACRTPAEACPLVFPNAGTECAPEEASCGPDCELVIRCVDGVWQWQEGLCPICAAADTPIATPAGERPIASLRVGDLVYSVDNDAIVAVPILRIGSTEVLHHHVVRITLAQGVQLEMSPGHPLSNGGTVQELVAGSWLDDQHRVVSAELVPYTHQRTYDILPGSHSGTYFAAGALLGSSLLQR